MYELSREAENLESSEICNTWSYCCLNLDGVMSRYIKDHNYLFKVNNRNTRKRCGKCSKLTTKKPDRRQ